MATSNQKPVKTVTINYVDPAPGQSTQLEIINDPGGNVGEVQFKTTGGLFGGSNAFVWNNTTSNLGVRGNLSVTGNIYGNISASSTNLKIKGGVSGDVLVTDGTGNLTWTSLQDAGGYGNSEVANYLPTYTGNLNGGNANLGNAVTANYFIGALYGTANLATFATTANSVALANVSDIGNIANINLTGSNSNILYGNGVFAPVGSANTGNWGFLNDTMYSLSGGEINNGDTVSGSTSGLILPENGNTTVRAALYNTYGNVQIQVANLGVSPATSIWEFGSDGALTVPGIITKANTVQLTSGGAVNSAAVIASGDHGRVTLRTDDGTTNKDWYFNIDGTTTFPNNTLKTLNGTDAAIPSTVGTAGSPLIISAGTGGIAATSLNAGDGGNLTIKAGDAGSDIGNPSWGAIGGTLVLRGGNSTMPFNGSNVEIHSGNSASSPGEISLHTGINQWTFDATGNLTVPGSLINDTSIVLSAPAVFNICTIATAGSGYNTGSSLKATTGGSGTGMTVGIGYGLSDQLTSVTVVNPGAGYVNGDVITVSEGTGGTFVLTKYNQLADQTNNNTVQTNITFANNTLTLPIYGEIIAPGNITANNIGNITPINLDGSNSNVLYGNGVFAPPGGAVISNGTSYANVVASNGNVVIGVDNDNMTWTFATDRKIYGLLDEDVQIVAVDDGAGVGVRQVIVDNSLNELSRTRLEESDYYIQFDLNGSANSWRFDSGSLRPPAGGVFEQYNSNIRMYAMDAGANPVASLQSVSNQNDPNIFTTIDATTTGANISVYNGGSNGGTGYTWKFANDGLLTLPSNNVVIGSLLGATVMLGNSAVVGVASQGNSGSTLLQWSDDISNTSAVSAIYINGPGANTGDIQVLTGSAGLGANIWTFGADGNLSLPGGGSVDGSDYDVTVAAGDDGSSTYGHVTLKTNGPLGVNEFYMNSLGELNLPRNGVIQETVITHEIWGTTTTALTLVPGGATNGTQRLEIYGTGNVADGDHIHITAGVGGATDLYLGNDLQYVSIGTTGEIDIQSRQGTNSPSPGTPATAGSPIFISAGDAGNNGGNTVDGAFGGDIVLSAGSSTDGLGGEITLVSGNGTTGRGSITLSTTGGDGYWDFDNSGNLNLPTVSLGTGLSEQTKIRSQRKIIPSNYYSIDIQNGIATVVYTATANNIMTLKGTFTIQHDALGYEMFDLSASRDLTGNVYYAITNRIKPPTITDTTAIVDLNGSNVLQVTFTLNSGSLSAFVKYDTTEFGTSI